MPSRLQRFTNYLLRHRWQALALTFVSTFIPIVGILGILIAALMTLVRGIAEGALFTLAATLPYFFSFLLNGGDAPVPLVAWAAVGVAVLSNMLTWVFGSMLYKRATWGLIFQVAALMGVLVISVIHLIYPQVADWWGQQLQSYYEQAATVTNMLKKTATAPQPSESQLEAINITKQYATGLMTAAILFNAILQLIAARWWQAVVFRPGSLRMELHNIRLSQLAGFLFVTSLAVSFFGNSVISDMMPVLYLLFAAAGLSIIHYYFGLMRSPTVWFWLSFMYLVLIYSLPVSVWILAMLGLLDIWLDIRKRYKKV